MGDQPSSPAPKETDTSSAQPRDPKMQAARVRLPDGEFKEFEVNRSSEGEALFQQVTANLSIEEKEYFSLCFYDKTEGTRYWLYNDKKILRQLKGLPWDFSFEVKFYPTTPTTLVDDHARYYLFLQLRRDLITGRLPATADTHALLGSYVAQIEFGDCPHQTSEEYEKFVVGARLVPTSHAAPETFAKIAELHRELRGQTTSEAELLFLERCRQLDLYGVHLFKATDKDDKAVDIGIGAPGINIYQGEEKVHTFLWQNIIKIGFKRRYFSVKLKSGIVRKETLYFKLATHLAAKRTWKCAVEHHTFFRLIQPEDQHQKSFFNFGSQRFRYQGRTEFQTKMASQMFDQHSNVDRAPSSMSFTTNEEQTLNTLNLTDSEVEQVNFEVNGQPSTTISTQQDTSDVPGQVGVEDEENGRQITSINFIADEDQVPVGVEQVTPIGQQDAVTNEEESTEVSFVNGENGIIETEVCGEQQGDVLAPPEWSDQTLGEFVASNRVTHGNRTIETITYKIEKDGVIETHVEHRITILTDEDIDYDAELSQAILQATQMNPNMVVEKVEVC